MQIQFLQRRNMIKAERSVRLALIMLSIGLNGRAVRSKSLMR